MLLRAADERTVLYKTSHPLALILALILTLTVPHPHPPCPLKGSC